MSFRNKESDMKQYTIAEYEEAGLSAGDEDYGEDTEQEEK